MTLNLQKHACLGMAFALFCLQSSASVPTRAEDYAALGLAKVLTGTGPVAVHLYKRRLADFIRRFGTDSEDVATCRLEMSMQYEAANKLAEANKILDEIAVPQKGEIDHFVRILPLYAVDACRREHFEYASRLTNMATATVHEHVPAPGANVEFHAHSARQLLQLQQIQQANKVIKLVLDATKDPLPPDTLFLAAKSSGLLELGVACLNAGDTRTAQVLGERGSSLGREYAETRAADARGLELIGSACCATATAYFQHDDERMAVSFGEQGLNCLGLTASQSWDNSTRKELNALANECELHHKNSLLQAIKKFQAL